MIRCNFCAGEIRGTGYRLLPIIDLRTFPPVGVYACADCLAEAGPEALEAKWYEMTAAEEDGGRGPVKQFAMLEVAA